MNACYAKLSVMVFKKRANWVEFFRVEMERDITSQNVPYQPDLKGELTLIDQSRLLSLAPQNSAAMSQEIDTTLTNESPGCRGGSGLNNTHVIQTLIEQNKILTEKVNDVWNQQASLSVRGMMAQSFSGRAGISSGGFAMGLSGDCCYSCSEKERQIEELTRTLGKVSGGNWFGGGGGGAQRKR